MLNGSYVLRPYKTSLFYDKEVLFLAKGYNGNTCEFDPDLFIYRQQWIEHTAVTIKESFEFVNLVKMAGGHAPISVKEWMELDLFTREAIKMASNEVFKEMEKEQKAIQSKLEDKLESNKEYRSPFEGAPKPTFIGN